MPSKEYRPRIADATLEEKLEGAGAVLIEGPKWCGKTTTAEQKSASIIYMNDPRSREANIQAATLDPDLILDGATPRLIDEWQIAPRLWDAVRFAVDHRNEGGQFVLTGSAVPLTDEDERQRMHTGTGRISRMRMRTMSLWESGDSSGKVSLRGMFEGEIPRATDETSLERIAFLTCRGGWPRSITQKPAVALGRAVDYYDAVVNMDINRTDRSLKDPDFAMRLMRSYARFQGSQTSVASIAADISAGAGSTPDPRTVQSYINALKEIFVIEDMGAWNPNLRSKSAIRTGDTRYFVDPSIATAALGIGPADLLKDLNTFGFLFETLCVRDLRVYAEALRGAVYHYRDSKGLECDAVIHLRDGRYALVEIKLGGDKLIGEGATSLLKLRGKINTEKMSEPAFMMILTAVGKFAFRREDGIFVVPISCLRD